MLNSCIMQSDLGYEPLYLFKEHPLIKQLSDAIRFELYIEPNYKCTERKSSYWCDEMVIAISTVWLRID